MSVHTSRRGVKIPIAAIVAALPLAVRAARESGADNRDAESPGGVKVTPGEVAEDLGAFLATLAEIALPAILAAND